MHFLNSRLYPQRILWVLCALLLHLGCAPSGPDPAPTPKLSKGQEYARDAKESAAKSDFKRAATLGHLGVDKLRRETRKEEAAALLILTAEYEVKSGDLEAALSTYDKLIEANPKLKKFKEEKANLEKQLASQADTGRAKKALESLKEAEHQVKNGGETRARIILDEIESELKATGDPKLMERVRKVRAGIAQAEKSQRDERKGRVRKFLKASSKVVGGLGPKDSSGYPRISVRNEKLILEDKGKKYLDDAKAGIYGVDVLKRDIAKIKKYKKRRWETRPVVIVR